jgi:hypothetical protein
VTDMAPHPLRGPGAVEAPSDGDLIRLGAILAAIARGWWIVILATAACVALAWHYAVQRGDPDVSRLGLHRSGNDGTCLHQFR